MCGWGVAESEKKYKQQAHSSERAKVKQYLHIYLDDTKLPHTKQFGDRWFGPKDGKQWFGQMKSSPSYRCSFLKELLLGESYTLLNHEYSPKYGCDCDYKKLMRK